MEDMIPALGASLSDAGGDTTGGAGSWAQSLGLGNWFHDLTSAASSIVPAVLNGPAVAQANATGAALQYAAAQQAQQQAVANAIALRQAGVTGSPGISTNMILVVMVGAAIFFVINQANK